METQIIYMKENKKYLFIYKDLYDSEDEWSILAQGDDELSALKSAIEKIMVSYNKLNNKLVDIMKLLNDDIYSQIYDNLMIGSEYIETNPENPCDLPDTRYCTKANAVFWHEKENTWGYSFR